MVASQVGLGQTNIRLVIVTRNTPPTIGGMERLLGDICSACSKLGQLTLVAPDNTRVTESCELIEAAPLMPTARFLGRSLLASIRTVKKRQPAWLLAGSVLMLPIVRLAAHFAAKRPHIVCYAHGLDVIYPHWLYQRLFVAGLRQVDQVWCNSQATQSLVTALGVDHKRVKIIPPACRTPTQADGDASAAFRRRHHLGEHSPLLLIVGRLTARKGCLHFLQTMWPSLLAALPDAILLIIGDDPKQAARQQTGEAKAIDTLVAERNWGQSVRRLVDLDDEQLAAAYAAGTVHLMPLIAVANDFEGFGMVAIEAAAHGLATIAFAVGGVVDAVAHGKSGYLVEAGDHDAFVKTTVDFVRCATVSGLSVDAATCHQFAEQFALERLEQRVALAVAEAVNVPVNSNYWTPGPV